MNNKMRDNCGDSSSNSGGSSDPRVPLKTILQNFLNHVESLEARKREDEDEYEKEFLVRPKEQ